MDVKKTTDKRNLKRSRGKMYFLQAAKEMIAGEGVESVSVRKVADAAGYSYPTLYNYFEDLNELLWETKLFMIHELMEELQRKMQYPIEDKEGIKKAFKTYMEYYLANPNVFRFFYFYSVHKPSRESEDALVDPDYNAMWRETFKSFVLNGRLKPEDIETVAKISIYAIHGMLTLSFSNNGELGDEESLFRDLNKIVDYLL